MTKKIIQLSLALLFVMPMSQVFAQESYQKFSKVKELGGIEEYIYEPNGMNMLLVQDNSAPVVTVQVVYRVGSKHEVTGNTGSTHLLEHLMFKGTEKFNKQKGTDISGILNSIGAQMNATTWNDRTNYYETIPSDKIEVALEIEADRMRNSLLLKEDKDAEMTVVRNEFERGENNPNSVLSKEIWATAYMAHTYHHSTIGWRSDIEKMPIEVLREFYNTYYWPNNATLTIIGDFQKDELFNMVDKYFGKITKAPHPMPQPYTEEPQQYGPRKVVVKKPGNTGVILIGYKIPGRLHEDLPALTILGQLIGSGTSSLVNREFIDKKMAFYGYASPSNFRENGLFTIGLGIDPNSDYDSVNNKLLGAIEGIKTQGVPQEDVDRVISKLSAQTILNRDGSGRIASQLNEAIAAGDWTDYIKGVERLAKVTAEDVKRVANQYLVEDQSTTGYFIPKNQNGGNKPVTKGSSSYTPEDSKYYYRHPYHNIPREAISDTYHNVIGSPSRVEGNYIRKKINGIDVITAKTGAQGFVTVAASLSIGKYYNAKGNTAIPGLVVDMLSKGTTKNDKFAFSQKLEELGVSISIGVNGQHVKLNFKCLKKDLGAVVNLLAEELRYPLFDEKEFDILKTQKVGSMKQSLSNPETRGSIALSQAIYPKGHPNYYDSIEYSIEEIEKATLEEVKSFHKKYFGPADMHLVAVGDVDTKSLYNALKGGFNGWNGGIAGTTDYTEPQKRNGMTEIVTIPEKPSAELLIGQYTGLKVTDADYIPFYIGNFALGGGFAGRLMKTVRDEDGLTYSIGSRHAGHYDSGGHWRINASFNPGLFQKGFDATMAQLEKWVNEGITQEELNAKKSNLTGRYKVGLSTTGGLAASILSFVEQGEVPGYIQQYPKEIEAVTLDQVNSAIKKYIDMDKLIIIKSGSLDKDGKPLKP